MGQDNQPHQIKWFATEIDADPANVEFPAPEFTVDFSSDSIIVNSNGIPSFEFIAKTPNGLAVQAYNWEIPRTPVPAATFTQIPLLGTVAFTTTGLPIYGPNEAQHPDPYGDPYVNQILDFCHGHTGGQGDYHFHAAPECLIQHPDGSEEHYNIVGFALDGYPLIAHYKSVLDASGNPVLNADGETQFDWLETSGYEPNPAYKTQVLEGGEISTYAWDNYGYGAGRLDRGKRATDGRDRSADTLARRCIAGAHIGLCDTIRADRVDGYDSIFRAGSARLCLAAGQGCLYAGLDIHASHRGDRYLPTASLGMDFLSALLFLTAIFTGGMFGGGVSAILMNIPGTSSAVATTFDGFPMARQGKPGLALGVDVQRKYQFAGNGIGSGYRNTGAYQALPYARVLVHGVRASASQSEAE